MGNSNATCVIEDGYPRCTRTDKVQWMNAAGGEMISGVCYDDIRTDTAKLVCDITTDNAGVRVTKRFAEP